MKEYEEFSKKKEKMKSSMAVMKKEIDGFSKKEEAWVKKVGELTRRHEIEMNDLKKSFEADKLKLKPIGKLWMCKGKPSMKRKMAKRLLSLKPLVTTSGSLSKAFIRLTYPYVSEVSSCFGKPLSILHGLKLAGLNEMVCAEVLDSLSKKRSRSGDSEET
ncbi:hypothetical protein Hanom_Chr00s000006g01614191 [Helianthus anomalus]